MKIDQQIESLIEVASRLIELMNREVEILRAMRPADLEALREEKFSLIELYEQQYRALSAKKDSLVLVAPALQNEFADVARRFNEALAENGRALTAAKVAHERMMQAIVEAVQADTKSGRGYSASGDAEDGATGTSMSLSLDCRL